MDHVRPLQAVIPGAQGEILAALLRTDAPLAMRALARVAGVSRNQTSVVVERLVALGLVDRRDTGPSSLISIIEESPVVAGLRLVMDLHAETLRRWQIAAEALTPPPLALTVYGSWARQEARQGSDVDVLLVLPDDLLQGSEDDYRQAFADWCRYATAVAGLPVSPIIVTRTELLGLYEPLRRSIARDEVVIAGSATKGLTSGG